ncbi:MAG: hypothetical protein QM217_08500 [Bacillota bacterium]|nr:hypothetical protein [Bacillota bacterium]
MATKSMLKTVTIKDKKLGRTFIEVLEKSQSVKGKEVNLTWKLTELKGDKVKSFFD